MDIRWHGHDFVLQQAASTLRSVVEFPLGLNLVQEILTKVAVENFRACLVESSLT